MATTVNDTQDWALATIEHDGWQLESAEARHAASPATFEIPTREAREGLKRGAGVKLLFRITGEPGGEPGVERMWVLVRERRESTEARILYQGILDSAPATGSATLSRGARIVFTPEHVAAIDAPPRHYIVRHYGEEFFGP